MPLLDPHQQFYFSLSCRSNSKQQNISPSFFSFYLKYLPIASRNLHHNLASVQFYELFEQCFLKDYIKNVSNIFNLSISAKDLEVSMKSDLFLFFYNFLVQSRKVDTVQMNGKYLLIKSKTKMRFFEPFLEYSLYRHWYFTDSSFVILSVHIDSLKNVNDKNLYILIKMEASILKSLGFTIALCCYINFSTLDYNFLFDLIEENFFSEIHMNLDHKSPKNLGIFTERIKQIISRSHKFDEFDFYGYFYIYISYSPEIDELIFNDKDFVNYLDENPYFSHFFYSKNLNACLQKVEKEEISPFCYCESGFKMNLVKVNFCEIPLFEKQFDDDCLSPSEMFSIKNGYVGQDDFLNWNGSRVEVLFEDNTILYVDFDDLHKIKPELYVDDTLLMMKKRTEIHLIIKCIEDKYQELFKNKVSFDQINKATNRLSSDLMTSISDILSNFSCAFHTSTNYKDYFRVHRNQLFLAFEVCYSAFLKGEKTDQKGIIYQLETGEGKSLVIELIAATLAAKKKCVNIVTSNIHLAKRDYVKSFKFFQKLNIKTSILLHKNERKPPKRASKEYLKAYEEAFEVNEISNDELFENPLRMNFPVCGFGNDFKEIKNCPKVIFSTISNFEALYLKMTENWSISNSEKFFKNKVLIIDEADTILIDDLENGTIISHPIKSNSSRLLKLVYQCKTGKLTHKNLKKIMNFFGVKLSLKERKKFYSDYEKLKLGETKEKLIDFAFSTKLVTIKFLAFFIKEVFSINENEKINEIVRKYKETKSSSSLKINERKINFISFICQTKRGNPNTKRLQKIIQRFWQESCDITEDHLRIMFKEIELVHSSIFQNGKKYVVEKIDTDSKDNTLKKITNVLRDFSEFSDLNKIEGLFIKNKKKEEEEEEEEEVEEEEEEDMTEKEYEIIPFDYDNKGILEKNKEFSGFVQQFIAIKEMMNDEEKKGKIKIKEMSLNYLFVSHPNFIKLYESVYGLTGTIGNENDSAILSENYNLMTFKVPRFNQNHLVELPIILCKDKFDKKTKIVEEVLSFHLLNVPVLVILQNLKDIEYIKKELEAKQIKVNEFNGKDDQKDPEHIAGIDGAVSLGTNFCGRGANIVAEHNPLHVIVTYYSSNVRVIHQAFGRTARNGKEGSCRIICLIKEYINPKNMKKAELSDFDLKRKKQLEFIQKYQKKMSCIFDHTVAKAPQIDTNLISKLKETRINVNRMTAYTYKFPACMSIDTFLQIQAQKIFSIYNCPNSIYTWMLFQRYIREMLFESWSIIIEKVDRNYLYVRDKNILKTYKHYEDYLDEEIKLLNDKLAKYFPSKENPNFVDIFESIFNNIDNHWSGLFKDFYNEFEHRYLPLKTTMFSHGFLSINFGLMSFSLMDESGARISNSNNKNNKAEINYIKDPEISYYKRKENKKSIASITTKIDDLFEKICQKINEVIGGYIGLKFFLRRTIAGCEFGVCYDFGLSNEYWKQSDIKADFKNCLIDKDPLFLFTIQTKSKVAILSGILIIILVYIGRIASFIQSFIKNAAKNVKNVVLDTIIKFVNHFSKKSLSEKIDDMLKNVMNYLKGKLDDQLDNIKRFDSDTSDSLRKLSNVLTQKEFSKVINEILGKIGSFFVIGKVAKNVFEEIFPSFFKIGFLIVLLLVAFFMNFNHRNAIKNDKHAEYKPEQKAKEYESQSSKIDKDGFIDESKKIIDSIV
ncbi:hypothetical protein M9Y10_037294 [Tritrichomonas musculus]|uniref:SecA family profile domain-containing protein n=1 Tax=Tritrichomonas musculus TaxID=1915356 RepID=A0ABR2GT92_9EUKA